MESVCFCPAMRWWWWIINFFVYFSRWLFYWRINRFVENEVKSCCLLLLEIIYYPDWKTSDYISASSNKRLTQIFYHLLSNKRSSNFGELRSKLWQDLEEKYYFTLLVLWHLWVLRKLLIVPTCPVFCSLLSPVCLVTLVTLLSLVTLLTLVSTTSHWLMSSPDRLRSITNRPISWLVKKKNYQWKIWYVWLNINCQEILIENYGWFMMTFQILRT